MHMRGVVWSERSQARYELGFSDAWSDRRIASFVIAAPQSVLNSPGERKRLVLHSMRGIMPEKFRQNVSKISPEPLYKEAIINKAEDTVTGLITNSRSESLGFIDKNILCKHYESIRSGGPEHHCFWQALTLEMWLRQYF